MRDYRKIIAWQRADDLTVAIYQVTKAFPRDEIYGLTSQLGRAAYSVPANIVEGASRNSLKDYLHFLYMARGSLHETHYFVHLAQRLGYLPPEAGGALTAQAEEASRTLTGLIRAVEKEAGPLGKMVARVTSWAALAIGSLVFRL